MADAGEIEALFDTVERTLGGVDLLVNNAGIAIFGPVAEMTEALSLIHI